MAFAEWKRGGRPNDPNLPLLIAKRTSRQALQRVFRNQTAAKHPEERQETLDARSENVQRFHKQIRKQRGSLSNYMDELHIAEEVYKGENVLGWFEHFKGLLAASNDPSFDQGYHNLGLQDIAEIEKICIAQGQLAEPVTVEEMKKPINNLNREKAADAMGITAEYLVFAEDSTLDTLCLCLNRKFQSGLVTDSMKLGQVTPVFKKKGSNTDSMNYRG